MRVFIMRGIPGSGKSTWVKNAWGANEKEDWSIWSADKYHIENGIYRFDPKRAPEAHAWCLKNFIRELVSGEADVLVCDNTNTAVWEIAPYYQAALAFGYQPEIVHVVCDLATAGHRNTHNVPATTIHRMWLNIVNEPLPSWWNITTVIEDTP